MTTPNTALRAARLGLRMSQDDMARALREAGCRSASKRLVQRWESGTITAPRPSHALALERVTGLPIATLGFSPVGVLAVVRASGRSDDAPTGAGDDSGEFVYDEGGQNPHGPGDASAVYRPRPGSNLTGIWRSRYEYPSSGRGATFAGLHHAVILQHGDQVNVRSLPGSAASRLTLDLRLTGGVVTGNWSETTDPDGYYRGATYYGAIQLLVDPTGRHLTGKWVGFGSNFDINSGPWEFTLLDHDTSRAAIDRWNHSPEQPG